MGGSKKVEAPPQPKPAPTASDIARQQVQAQIEFAPQAAQAEFDIQQKFLPQMTALQEQVRQTQFPGEQAVRGQLQQNVLGALQSPTGATPDQILAQQAIRERAEGELVRALRTRANLGGGLFGGRAGRTEERATSELQQAFATEDIERDRVARLNAIQSALPFLQTLFPQVGITPLNFTSPVPTAGQSLSAALQGRQQDIGVSQYDSQLALGQQQTQNQLLGSLFQGLGTATGGALQGWLGKK